ncbi:polysaccharide deacetylase family protein [Candidatus Uhrbacteria bacterium]|nr:polysaccharide deacetylase family protein [Candidatus Uhrbacteria bacterium]
MKKIIFQILLSLGITNLFRIWQRKNLTIVLYHGVRPAADKTSIDIRGKHIHEKIFREHIRYLKKHYHVLGWSEAIDFLKTKKSFPANALCITFDDGYANHALAGRILHELQVPAIFYVTSGFIDGRSLWTDRFECAHTKLHGEDLMKDQALRQTLKDMPQSEREKIIQELEVQARVSSHVSPPLLQPMTWDQVRALIKQGHEIGAHTVTHPILSRESEETVKQELNEGKRKIEQETGIACHHFAYPNGQPQDFTRETIRFVQEAGFASAVTTITGGVEIGNDPYTLKRISLDHCLDIPTLAATVSGVRHLLSTIL